MWRYVRALDTMDADGYAAVFTTDGTFGSGSTQRKGRADLKAMVADLKKGRDERAAAGTPSAPMYHVIANHQITFTGADAARYDSYWMTVFGAAGPETPPRVAAAGRGVDELVRVGGPWLIKNGTSRHSRRRERAPPPRRFAQVRSARCADVSSARDQLLGVLAISTSRLSRPRGERTHLRAPSPGEKPASGTRRPTNGA
jgi:hypothetical protein